MKYFKEDEFKCLAGERGFLETWQCSCDDGWHKMREEPMKLLAAYPHLSLKPGMVLSILFEEPGELFEMHELVPQRWTLPEALPEIRLPRVHMHASGVSVGFFTSSCHVTESILKWVDSYLNPDGSTGQGFVCETRTIEVVSGMGG